MLRSTWLSFIIHPPHEWQANQTPEDISHILAPALIVVGEHDQDISHRVSKAMESHLSKGKIVVTDGGAFHVNMDQPDEFYRLVIDFLRQVDGST